MQDKFKQITSTVQHRPVLENMKERADNLRNVTASSISNIRSIELTLFAFDVQCLIAYTIELEEKLKASGEQWDCKT